MRADMSTDTSEALVSHYTSRSHYTHVYTHACTVHARVHTPTLLRPTLLVHMPAISTLVPIGDRGDAAACNFTCLHTCPHTCRNAGGGWTRVPLWNRESVEATFGHVYTTYTHAHTCHFVCTKSSRVMFVYTKSRHYVTQSRGIMLHKVEALCYAMSRHYVTQSRGASRSCLAITHQCHASRQVAGLSYSTASPPSSVECRSQNLTMPPKCSTSRSACPSRPSCPSRSGYLGPAPPRPTLLRPTLRT